ncbi:MAG: hydroxymethylglutaryl-CoA reductase, degradative [Candidatus Micrarchaeota archaeon]
MAEKSSEISGFYKLGFEERARFLKEFAGLSEEEITLLKNTGALGREFADKMIENVVGGFTLPLGIATNFRINGKDYLIPMALEEPSVVAAASNAAKLARAGGGFTASADEPIMIGQIQLTKIKNVKEAQAAILENKKELLALANSRDSTLIRLGGGAKEVEARAILTPRGEMLIIYLYVDVRDAMGANAVNTMAEMLAPRAEEITGGKARLRIVSNLATKRLARAGAVFKRDVVGEDVVEGVLDAYEFARANGYRCATHNKGIMNGIDAVALATGNDWRALEAGAHSYACMSGKYQPLTSYEKNKSGDLLGKIELPLAAGTVGGATRHPTARVALKILGVNGARELACVMAGVGLAQNFAALRALATEGIQKGHMKLHARKNE